MRSDSGTSLVRPGVERAPRRSAGNRRLRSVAGLVDRVSGTGPVESIPARRVRRARASRRSRSETTRFRRHRYAIAWTPSASDLPVFVAVPTVLVLAGFALSLLGFFDLYVDRVGMAVPETPARTLIEVPEERTARGGGEPLSIDATVFEQIRRVQYTVQPGDTISEIAYRFGLNTGTLLSMNPIDDVRRLLPGTVLSIPDRDGLLVSVQPGDSISSIAASYGASVAAVLDANDLATTVVQVGDSLFIPGAEMDEDQYLLAIGELLSWPVRNFSFTSGYGMRVDPITGQWRMHAGIDLANVIGTPVGAARAGRVVHVEPNSGNYGNLVIIDHGAGIRTLYAHLNSYVVSVGQYVSTGQLIGRVGNTGRSTGPHLHFAVTRNGRWEDPLAHLP